MRATGTFKPKPDWEPETKIFNPTNIEISARNAVLTNKSRIPDAALGNIKTQFDLIYLQPPKSPTQAKEMAGNTKAKKGTQPKNTPPGF
jgi:hypothetical protein